MTGALRIASTAAGIALALLGGACGRRDQAPPAGSPLGLRSFSARPIGRPPEGIPWIVDVQVADLDRDGLNDVLVCDGRRNRVSWARQGSPGEFEERDIGDTIAGPAHIEVSDLDADGDLDVLVASMGVIPPTNAPAGAVVVLENDGANHFRHRVLLENVARVTYVGAADFNRDGRQDLVVGQFGYLQGEIRWMENRGGWEFRSQTLLDLPGTIHSPAVDFDGDGNMDIVALVSQDTEEIHAFFGDGAGRFRQQTLYGSTNKDFGSSGLTVADVDRDGLPDIVYTNGDGFDYATPGSRPWHGVQWLRNLGGRAVAYQRIGDFPGAYSPVVVDLDRDGDRDVVACSAFNDWKDPAAVALMAFENDGAQGFTPRVLAHRPTHLIVLKALEIPDRTGPALVAGALMFYPPYTTTSRLTLWEPSVER